MNVVVGHNVFICTNISILENIVNMSQKLKLIG